MTDRIVRSLPVVGVCAAAWVLLHGDWSGINLFWGVVIGVGLAVLFPVDRSAMRHRLHPWGLLKFVVFVLWSLVQSSWAVIKVIVRPTPTNLAAGIVRIRLTSESPLTTTVVANAITLTPGTLTLTARVGPSELHVHAIGLDSGPGGLDDFRASALDLEQRALAALEPLEPGEGEQP
ncbi:MAG TPA: Na+/H+ antiporter subunit E [Ilumatobacter sp.]|nr:Na+/H+ antiporter subunit E [Ilumatobacter sp.]